jgi:hypothetical protein
MHHSLGFLSWGTVALDSVNRRLSFVDWPQIYQDVGSAPGPGPSRTEIAECRLNPSTAPSSLHTISHIDPAMPGSPETQARTDNLFNRQNKLIGDMEGHEALSPEIVGKRHHPP